MDPNFMTAVNERKLAVLETVVELEETIARLDRDIWILNNTHHGRTSTVITAVIDAEIDCDVSFRLTYRMPFFFRNVCEFCVR